MQSQEETFITADIVIDVCRLFVEPYAEKLLLDYKSTQLVDCINELLKAFKSLPQ